MKTKITLVLSILFIGLTSFTAINQDSKTVKGQFDGHEDYGYNFLVLNNDDEERTLTFQEVDQSVLDKFNLNSEDLVGANFEITYTITTETVIDENGDEEEDETFTITALKQIK